MAKMFISGQSVNAIDGEKIDVVNPSDGKVFTSIPRGKEADIDLAVKAARNALSGAWGKLAAFERGRLLCKLSDKILEHKQELADLEARDTGKPISFAINDIVVLARYFEFYGGGADKVHGQTIPFLNGYSVQVVREPLGVTAHIIPWNYPAQMLGRSIGPALAMGNSVVVKPAEDACLSVIRVAELAAEVGFPPAAINVVTGLGEEAGAALSKHRDINFISFTGSNEVGIMIQQAAAVHSVPCTLELGGKSAHVVFDDADFEKAAASISKGIIANTGQTCTAGSRVLIQENCFDEFMKVLVADFSKKTAGTPEMDLDCGPLISETQFKRVNSYIELGKEQGLKIIVEGNIADGVPEGGYFVRPTIFGAPNHNSRLLTEEIFGPVLVAVPFKDEQEAIELANATDYGLMAAVWSENGGRQQRLAKGMQAGQVYINSFGAGGGVELPFGGVKHSGHGREKGFVAMEEMCTLKTIINYHG